MSFETYETKQGDMVDEIAFRRFGRSSEAVTAILDANPGLAARGPVLPAGLVIRIPPPVDKGRTEKKRIWS